MRVEDFSSLIEAGLIRPSFVIDADAGTLASLSHFQNLYEARMGDSRKGRPSTGARMIQHGVLSTDFFENIIIARDPSTEPPSAGPDQVEEIQRRFDKQKKKFEAFAAFMGTPSSTVLEKLLEDRKLSTPVIMQLVKRMPDALTDPQKLKRLASIAETGKSNAINWGIEILEYEAAREIAIRNKAYRDKHRRPDAFIEEKNRLLKAFRASEYVASKRRQVKAALPKNDVRPVTDQFESVWNHYARHSGLFRDISQQVPIADEVREKNAMMVNQWQLDHLRKKRKLPPEDHGRRYLDIYIRYHQAEMDPFMAAIVTRTARWYIEESHSSLFTDIRLSHDRFKLRDGSQDHIAWAVKAVNPKVGLLRKWGQNFAESLLGANRIFLTHSNANEATQESSIPIIGLATWGNSIKAEPESPYALLAASFDKRNPTQFGNRKWWGRDHAASIAGVINETLRALREAEDLEVARANGLPLVLGGDNRWTAQNDPPKKMNRLVSRLIGLRK